MWPQVRELIYREILEYHPHMLHDYLQGGRNNQANFMYPSAVDNFRRQFAHLEGSNGQQARRQGQQNLGQVRPEMSACLGLGALGSERRVVGVQHAG